MLKLTLIFAAWAAVGTLIYFTVSPWGLVGYGIGSMVFGLIWAATRKK